MVDSKGQIQFMPGIYTTNDDGREIFVPGMNIETLEGTMFVEGKLHKGPGGKEAIFVPGKVLQDGSNKFEKAEGPADMKCRRSPEPSVALDGSSLSLVFKKAKPRNGFMVKTKNGAKFYR